MHANLKILRKVRKVLRGRTTARFRISVVEDPFGATPPLCKLDGVGPVDNKPSTNNFQNSVWENFFFDMRHVTCCRGWTFSQNFSTLFLTVCVIWYFEDLEEKADSLTEWITKVFVEQPVNNTPVNSCYKWSFRFTPIRLFFSLPNITESKPHVVIFSPFSQKLLPHGNFEMLSRLNELELCGFFFYWMTTWPRLLFGLRKSTQVQSTE